MKPFSQQIQKEYLRLKQVITPISKTSRQKKLIDGTGGKVSVADLIAYQIGWGKCVIRWYQAGIKNQTPDMPGEGFTKWDYVGIANHFYQKYAYDQFKEQEKIFDQVVNEIISIVEEENILDQLGIYSWCTLASGKQWPLKKWIQINTIAPYKRAYQLIKKTPDIV